MARRGGSARTVCTFEGCSEVGWFDYDSQKEYYKDILPRMKTWRCVRHHNDALDVLSLKNDRLTEALEVIEMPYGKFWAKIGTYNPDNGFVHGPGFKAWAKDFAPGTKIRITAEVIST